MKKIALKIRLMQADDFTAVTQIDEKVLGVSRPDYYKLKFEELVQSTDRLPTSLVAEDGKGNLVGFVMGELFIGQYGISHEATLDTIGVDPDFQHQGVGRQLLQEFRDHLKALGARKIKTLVDTENTRMMRFFQANRFAPSKTINLEYSL